MDLSEYLSRIAYIGPTDCTLETLRDLTTAHLKTIPFDTLELANRKSLEIGELYHRIVKLKRGGTCKELNGLYAWLLSQLGFDVDLIRGDTLQYNDNLCKRDHHPVIRVRLHDEEWLVDVGNAGNLFLGPLRLEVDVSQDMINGKFMITKEEELYTLKRERKRQIIDGQIRERSNPSTERWKILYRFCTTSEKLSDFEEDFQFLKVTPSSFNVRNSLCTILTEKGLTILWGKTLIRKEYVDSKTEKILQWSYIPAHEKLTEILHNVFGITLSSNVTFLALDLKHNMGIGNVSAFSDLK